MAIALPGGVNRKNIKPIEPTAHKIAITNIKTPNLYDEGLNTICLVSFDLQEFTADMYIADIVRKKTEITNNKKVLASIYYIKIFY